MFTSSGGLQQSWSTIVATSTSKRAYLSDRKSLVSLLKPSHRLFSIVVTRFAIVQADHGNMLMQKYGNDLDALEAHQNAWLNPFDDSAPPVGFSGSISNEFLHQTGTIIDPSIFSRSQDEEDEEDEENQRLTVTSPWPMLLKNLAYGTARDLSIIAITWGLEELALVYFSEKTCDELTKNAYNSGQRKMERNDSKLETTKQFFTMHLKSTCLRWTAVFCVNTFRSIYKRATLLKPTGSSEEEDGESNRLISGSGGSGNNSTSNGSRSSMVPLNYEIRKNITNESVSWMLESLTASLVVLITPFKFGGTPHIYTYTLMNQLGFGIASILIKKPIIEKLFGSRV
jgi:hypothetical protein